MVQKLEKVVAIRLTANEHLRIKKMCDRAGMRLSDGIRWCIRESGALDSQEEEEGKTNE